MYTWRRPRSEECASCCWASPVSPQDAVHFGRAAGGRLRQTGRKDQLQRSTHTHSHTHFLVRIFSHNWQQYRDIVWLPSCRTRQKEFKELRKVQMTPHAGSIMTFPSLFSFGPDKVSQTKRCECSQRQLSTCVFYVKKCLIKKMLMKKRICSLLYNTF